MTPQFNKHLEIETATTSNAIQRECLYKTDRGIEDRQDTAY